MFLIVLTYIKPVAEADRFMAAHRDFIQREYAAGRFLLSGRKEPRDGGVIVARAGSRAEVEALIRDDPFHTEGIADFQIIEFRPSMAAPELSHLLEA